MLPESDMPKSAPNPMNRKLDKSRALAIMGFSTARALESCFGKHNKARELLDEALFKKTQEIFQGFSELDLPKK